MNRLATTVVTGLEAPGKTAYLERRLATRAAGRRWALLVQGLAAPDISSDLLPRDAMFQVAGACACCNARPAFELALTRLLRQGGWDRLLVDLGASAHAGSVIDLMRSGTSAQRLRIDEVVAVVDASRVDSQLAAPAGSVPAAHLEASCRIFVTGGDDLSANQADALVSRLGAHPPFERPVELAVQASNPCLARSRSVDEDWPALIESGESERLLEALSDELVSGRREAGKAGSWRFRRRWSAELVFDRQALQRASAHWREAEGIAPQGRAVFRTEREWYRWDFDGKPAWQPTGWRCDSRFELSVQGNNRL